MMSLDDRAAHRQANSHSVLLRRIEGLKELVRGIRSEADPRVLYAETHVLTLIRFASDQQISRAVLDANHRIRSVSHQVQDDLLELDTIARDRWEVDREFRPQD